ncbi:transposase [Rhizobium sp. BK456]|nr:transposase [Rhizobium sp. BK456]
MHAPKTFMVGIDVSKAHLDVAVEGKRTVVRFDNDAAGRAALATAIAGAELVVVEATGGYEMATVRALMAADIPVAVVNPRQIRDFARASGRLAKRSMPASFSTSPERCGRHRSPISTTAARHSKRAPS